MSRGVRDRAEFETGEKWFSDLHRSWDDDMTAIDIDLCGYCRTCTRPVYLVEATRSKGRKTAFVTERLAQIVGVPCVVVYVDDENRPGQVLVDNRTTGQIHNWMSEDDARLLFRALRNDHRCTRTT